MWANKGRCYKIGKYLKIAKGKYIIAYKITRTRSKKNPLIIEINKYKIIIIYINKIQIKYHRIIL